MSCSYSEVERQYSQIEKEMLSVVWGCEKFNLYLSGLESFQLVTDCKALEAIYGPKSIGQGGQMGVAPHAFQVHCVKCTIRSGYCRLPFRSQLKKIPALSHCNSTAEEYVRMVVISATPRAMTTREIERASTEDDELTEVHKCWKTEEIGPVLQAPTSSCMMKFLWS